MSIIKGTAKAVSDGSYRDGIGTSASVLVGEDEKIRITSINTIPGNKKTNHHIEVNLEE